MDSDAQSVDITRFLAEAARGDAAATERVWSSLYGELRRMARGQLTGERIDHTLSPTALVHEAYLKLGGGTHVAAADRRHFMALAARAMRQILVDHARGRSREKRGGPRRRMSLDEARDEPLDAGGEPELVLALDEALARLAGTRERMARVVELRYFGGFSAGETADILGVTRRTVERDWSFARAWLFRQLSS